MFDWRQMKRWGISIDEILAGSADSPGVRDVHSILDPLTGGASRSCNFTLAQNLGG